MKLSTPTQFIVCSALLFQSSNAEKDDRNLRDGKKKEHARNHETVQHFGLGATRGVLESDSARIVGGGGASEGEYPYFGTFP